MDESHVPPEVRQWILASANAGQPPAELLREMVTRGWPEFLAAAAMRSVLSQEPALPPETKVPDLGLDQSPSQISTGDRVVRILSRMCNPTIVSLGGLLSDTECAELIRLARPRLTPSTTVNNDTGGQILHHGRTSEGMFFARGENPLVARIERRIAKLTNWPLENGEGLQVLHYSPGTQYEPHYDYFIPEALGTPLILQRGGQRVASLIMYLNTPEQGGGTVFPDVEFEMTPQRGNAVYFSYSRAHPSSGTLHGGAPVIAGKKWIATKWLRERPHN